MPAPQRRSSPPDQRSTSWGERVRLSALSDFNAKIIAAVRAGTPVMQVAERFGRQPSRIYAICRAKGMTFGLKGSSGEQAARRAVFKQVATEAKRMTTAQLMERFGLSRATVGYACRLFRAKPKPAEVGGVRGRSLARRQRLRPHAQALLAGVPERRLWVATQLLTTDRPMGAIAEDAGLTRQGVWEVWVSLERLKAQEFEDKSQSVESLPEIKQPARSLAWLSTARLLQQEKHWKRRAAQLAARQEFIRTKLEAIRTQIARIERVKPRGRIGLLYRNERSLLETLTEVLRQRPMTPSEAAAAVYEAGYRSVALDFVGVVTAALKANKRFLRDAVGRYKVR